MIGEALLLMWLTTVGGLTLTRLWGRIPAWGLAALAFPAGLSVYVIASVALLGLGLRFTTIGALAVASLFAVVAVFTSGMRVTGGRTVRPLLAVGAAVATAAAVVTVIDLFPLTRVTPDSFRYLLTADHLEEVGSLANIHPGDLRARLLVVPLLHTGGSLTGLGYLPALTPLLAVSGAATATWISWEAFEMFGTPRPWRWRLYGAIGLLAVTTNRVVYNAFYINGHLMFAVLLLVAVGMVWLAVMRGDRVLLVPVSLAYAATVALRPDAILVGAVFLVVALSLPQLATRDRWLLVTPWAATSLTWHLLVYYPDAATGDRSLFGPIWSNVAVTLVLVALALVMSAAAPARRASRSLPALVLAGSGILAGLAALADPRLMWDSLYATAINVGWQGLWGAFWWVVPPLALWAAMRARVPTSSLWTVPSVAFGLILSALPFLRDGTYRVGTGDSANRSLMHVALVLIVFVVIAAGKTVALSGPERSDAEEGQPPGRPSAR